MFECLRYRLSGLSSGPDRRVVVERIVGGQAAEYVAVVAQF